MKFWEMNQAQTAAVETEFPQMKYKEARLTVGMVLVGIIVAVIYALAVCFLFGELREVIKYGSQKNDEGSLLIMILVFSLIALVLVFAVIQSIVWHIKVKLMGERVPARVRRYTNDTLRVKDRPAQIVELLVNTPDGWRSILYRLHCAERPYYINSTIEILMYKDLVLIPKKQRYN